MLDDFKNIHYAHAFIIFIFVFIFMYSNLHVMSKKNINFICSKFSPQCHNLSVFTLVLCPTMIAVKQSGSEWSIFIGQWFAVT